MNSAESRSTTQRVCHFYNTSTGCRNGATCRFKHTSESAPNPAASILSSRSGAGFIGSSSGRYLGKNQASCRFFAAGNCARGESCSFKHEHNSLPPNVASGSGTLSGHVEKQKVSFSVIEKPEEENPCTICYEEKPAKYGLLDGCGHPFCFDCIRAWRDASNKDASMVSSGAIKACPVCRAPSKFITPSNSFHGHADPMKSTVIASYKSRLAQIPCKHFQKSPPHRRFCPFGKDCFYQHHNFDGTPYIFSHGSEQIAEHARRRSNRRARQEFEGLASVLDSIADDLISEHFERFLGLIEGSDSLDEEEDDEDEDEDEEEDEWDDDPENTWGPWYDDDHDLPWLRGTARSPTPPLPDHVAQHIVNMVEGAILGTSRRSDPTSLGAIWDVDDDDLDSNSDEGPPPPLEPINPRNRQLNFLTSSEVVDSEDDDGSPPLEELPSRRQPGSQARTEDSAGFRPASHLLPTFGTISDPQSGRSDRHDTLGTRERGDGQSRSNETTLQTGHPRQDDSSRNLRRDEDGW